jgi:hypothetical protein
MVSHGNDGRGQFYQLVLNCIVRQCKTIDPYGRIPVEVQLFKVNAVKKSSNCGFDPIDCITYLM